MQDTDTSPRPAFVSIEEFDVVTGWLEEARAQRDALDHKLARIASLPDDWEEKSHEWFKANRVPYEDNEWAEWFEKGWDNAAELLRRELAR